MTASLVLLKRANFKVLQDFSVLVPQAVERHFALYLQKHIDDYIAPTEIVYRLEVVQQHSDNEEAWAVKEFPDIWRVPLLLISEERELQKEAQEATIRACIQI